MEMDAVTFNILTSTNLPDLVERVHCSARELFHAEHTTLGIPSLSGCQILLAASTDTSTKWGQVLTVAHVPEFQRLLHEMKAVALGAGNGGIADVKQLGASYPEADLLVPALVRGKILGIIMWKTGGSLPGEPEALEKMATACAHAIERINHVESLRSDNARWHDEYSGLLGELEQHYLYGDLFRYNPDGMLLMDPAGRLLLGNPAAESVLLPDGSPLPELMSELLDESSRGRFEELLEGFRQGIFPRHLDLRIKRRSGEPADIAVSISLVPRELEVILLTLRNVSEERRLERELKEAKNFVDKIIGSSLDAIIASDMTGNIVMFNEEASRLWGIPIEEALSGLHVNDLYPLGQAKEIMQKLRSEEYGGIGKMTPQRIWLLSRTGDNIPVLLSAYIIYEENGREAFTIGTFSDLREKMRAEERIAFIQERLAQSEKQVELAELAGAMAHELNQPLTSILGSTELLIKHLATSEQGKRYARIIQDEASRMGSIIKKIGKVTRFETQSYVGKARIADLAEPGEDTGGKKDGEGGE